MYKLYAYINYYISYYYNLYKVCMRSFKYFKPRLTHLITSRDIRDAKSYLSNLLGTLLAKLDASDYLYH